MQHPGLLAAIRTEVKSLLGGYIQARELIQLIEKAGFKIRAMKMVHLTAPQAEEIRRGKFS